MTLQLFLGKQIEKNREYKTADVQGEFSLLSKLHNEKLYTLLLIDDSLETENGFFLHYLAVNVVPHHRRILMRELNPQPPIGERHKYSAILFEQHGSIDIQTLNKRRGFPVQAFADVHGLVEIERLDFFVYSPSASYTKEHYFIEENPLTEQQKKVCRCYLHVSEKNKCTKEEWGEEGCYHPYKTCGKSVGTSYKYCSEYYNFDDFTNDELRGYARAHGIEETGSRKSLLQNIRKKLEK